MTKRTFGNALASACAAVAGLGTAWASRWIHRPESLLDYAVLLFAGLVTGIFVFFVVWGHFQDGPARPDRAAGPSTSSGSPGA